MGTTRLPYTALRFKTNRGERAPTASPSCCPHPCTCAGWYVTPRQLKSAALYNLTSDYCYQGDAWANNNTDCQQIDSAPVRLLAGRV